MKSTVKLAEVTFVPAPPEAQTDVVPLIVAVGNAFTVTETVPVAVHPAPEVAVTE